MNAKPYDTHRVKRMHIREDKKQAGFFDGRFVARTETPKTVYTRKQKHKNQIQF